MEMDLILDEIHDENTISDVDSNLVLIKKGNEKDHDGDVDNNLAMIVELLKGQVEMTKKKMRSVWVERSEWLWKSSQF